MLMVDIDIRLMLLRYLEKLRVLWLLEFDGFIFFDIVMVFFFFIGFWGIWIFGSEDESELLFIEVLIINGFKRFFFFCNLFLVLGWYCFGGVNK